MVVRAASCFSGVTPAQQSRRTEISASGKADFSTSALDTTQMSVHRPISSISTSSASPASLRMTAGSRTAAKLVFCTCSQPSSSAARPGWTRQPSVPWMQWGTGSHRPSRVSR